MPTDEPGYPLSTGELADWLDRQDADSWWSVDGDPYLMGLIGFPAPADVLAARLRKIDRPLLVLDDRGAPGRSRLTADDLERHVYIDDHDRERIFRLRWDATPPGGEWLLIEDHESAVFARAQDGGD